MASTFNIRLGDVLVSSVNGRPSLITGTQKLKQDIKEFFEVAVQPNGFGSGLTDLVGLVQVDDDAFVSSAYSAIDRGLATFIQLQRADLTTPRPTDELMSTYQNIKVAKDPGDPTRFLFYVDITTVSGARVPYTGSLGI